MFRSNCRTSEWTAQYMAFGTQNGIVIRFYNENYNLLFKVVQNQSWEVDLMQTDQIKNFYPYSEFGNSVAYNFRTFKMGNDRSLIKNKDEAFKQLETFLDKFKDKKSIQVHKLLRNLLVDFYMSKFKV